MPETTEIGDDHDAMEAITALLDGVEWNADTLERIAEIVRATGREVRDFLPMAEGTLIASGADHG